MKYRVFVDDNFHYMDEEEAYFLSEVFSDEASAVSRAKGIVEECCADVKYDVSTYKGFGDDPLVVPPDGHARSGFSAWSYAEEVCAAKSSD